MAKTWFLLTYDNKEGVYDWVMARLWAESAFLPGFVQDYPYPQDTTGSTFEDENGDVYGPGRLRNKGDAYVWEPQSPMNFPGYHVSMIYKLKNRQSALNDRGFGFHVTADKGSRLRYGTERLSRISQTRTYQ